MKKNWPNYLFVITLLFFTLGFFNIIFAYLGLACLILPFVLLAKDKKKTWCQKYCPRSNLYKALFQGRSLTGKAGPDWLITGKGKWIILAYFCFNLLVIIGLAIFTPNMVPSLSNKHFIRPNFKQAE